MTKFSMKTFSLLCIIFLTISACGKQGAPQYAPAAEAPAVAAPMAKMAADSAAGNVGGAPCLLQAEIAKKMMHNKLKVFMPNFVMLLPR